MHKYFVMKNGIKVFSYIWKKKLEYKTWEIKKKKPREMKTYQIKKE